MSDLCQDIAQGLREAIAYERGELPASSVRRSLKFSPLPEGQPDEIKEIRSDGNPETLAAMDDVQNRRNLSGPFHDTKSMMEALAEDA